MVEYIIKAIAVSTLLFLFLNIKSVNGPGIRCGACTLSPATTEIAAAPLDTSPQTLTGNFSLTPPTTYVLFTAYSVTSDYPSSGFCITNSGPPVSLETIVSVTKAADAEPTAFRSTAIAKFVNYLGFTNCLNGASGLVNLALATSTTSSASLGATSPSVTLLTLLSASPSLLTSVAANNVTSTSSTRTSTASSSPILTKKDKVAIGTVIPVVAITSLLLAIIYLRRRRRKQSSSDKDKSAVADSSEDMQPYLQRKAELEAKEKQQHELDAQQLRYELDGTQTRYEAEGAESANEIAEERRVPGTLGLAHELRGEEHSKGLEGSKVE